VPRAATSPSLDDPQATPVVAIAALSFAAFASSASMRVTDPSLPRIATEFGITLASAAYVVTTFALGYGLVQVVFGPAGDRFGKIRVVAWMCAVSTVTALACAAAPTYATLLGARALAGAAAAAIIPLSMAWIGDVVPYEQRQPVLARFLTGQILGVAAGGTLGGFAADHLGWRMAFLFLAGWFCVAWLVLSSIGRSVPTAVVAQPRPRGLRGMVAEMREVAAHRWPRVVLTIVALEGVTLFGAFAFVATHLHARYGVSLTLAGSVTLMFGLGGLAFAVLSRVLVERLGETGLAATGAVLLGVSFTAVGIVPLQWLAGPCMLVAGLGFYMLHNTLQVQATQMAPARRGAAVSLFALCYFGGQSLGVGLGGYLLRFVDTGTVVAIGGILVSLVGLAFVALRQRRGLKLQ